MWWFNVQNVYKKVRCNIWYRRVCAFAQTKKPLDSLRLEIVDIFKLKSTQIPFKNNFYFIYLKPNIMFDKIS